MPSQAERSQVFISYRKGHEVFARALAGRLGREGFVPWFDEWELLAGDSVPGKIAEGLRDSVAFLPIITADYGEGKWATEELESAIHKRSLYAPSQNPSVS
ncbi:MAG: toll/interleukin-1 receptor domain-containing protein [Gemmatimonadetes bacterium]|nr:toll/interleukin-1 receptor domain-containing protein [Gemmatimonadota bacterium]